MFWPKKDYQTKQGKEQIAAMVRVADLTRASFINGDLNRDESAHGFNLGAKCGDFRRRYQPRLPGHLPEQMRRVGAADCVAEFYQRCFGDDLPEQAVSVLNS